MYFILLGGTMMPIKNPIVVGFTWAILTSISLLFVIILLVNFTSLAESSLPTITYAIHIVSILIGALKAGFLAKNKGWYYGGITGLSYMFFILIVGSILFASISLSMNSLIQAIAGVGVGMLGGIIGVNFNDR